VIGVVVLGDKFSPTGWLAIGVGLVAVVLIGIVPDATGSRPKLKGIVLAIVAGVGIGLTVTSLAQSPHDSGIAPVIITRFTACVILVLLNLPWIIQVAKKRQPLMIESVLAPKPGKLLAILIAAGLFDAAANILFTLASRSGSLTVAGVLTALYPLGTILLARVVLKEHITRVQGVGIFLALVASVLLAIG
jgi:drug/metabolite transporter (DMT)-like permease